MDLKLISVVFGRGPPNDLYQFLMFLVGVHYGFISNSFLLGIFFLSEQFYGQERFRHDPEPYGGLKANHIESYGCISYTIPRFS